MDRKDTWVSVEEDRVLVSGPTFDRLMSKTEKAGDVAYVQRVRYERRNLGSLPWQFGGMAIHSQPAFVRVKRG